MVDGVIGSSSSFFLLSVMVAAGEGRFSKQANFLGAALALESSTALPGLRRQQRHVAFKAAGICAPIVDSGIAGLKAASPSVGRCSSPR